MKILKHNLNDRQILALYFGMRFEIAWPGTGSQPKRGIIICTLVYITPRRNGECC